MALLSIELKINEKLYKNDPQRTDLGRKILQYSVIMIDELGLERFNFKKLAQRIGSTEASIYRYFENKYLLLIYLVNWYWEWMRFRIDLKTLEIEDPKKRLRAVVSCIVDTAKRNTTVAFIDEDILHRIVVAEGTKAYHNKAVDTQNRD
ncbi:MAG: TetR/AcrR family transcriptional regulator, partial [Mameliella sp.]|nr:TetR/AcrR family transcriptional regulator [Phaeodactylibacter sp.]